MNPVTVRNWLLCVLVAVVIAAVVPFAYYAPKIARANKDTAIHADALVNEGRLAAKKSVTLSDKSIEAMENFNQTITDLDKLIWKFDDTADATTGLLSTSGKKIVNISSAIVNRINALAVTQKKADDAIDQYATVPGHLNDVSDRLALALIPVPSTLQGLNNVSTEVTDYIRGPLTFATNNAGELEDSVNLTVDQGRKRWVSPWDGSHPFKHYAGVGMGYVGIGATLWRDTK